MTFEIFKCDLGGRIGSIQTSRGTVETPAFVPVIHPVRQGIPAAKIQDMGFNLVITNAYIAMKNHGEEAVRRGIHGIIGFDGPVMTDSGGYQVLEYGDVDTDPAAMARFEEGIGSDIAVPLDRPTGIGLSRKRAGELVRHTLRVSKETLENSSGGPLWAGPIQGSEHLDLVRSSAKALTGYGFRMMALGSPVEFMESYEYGPLAGMIAAARESIPDSVPLHLFGAGHPLTIPLAISLGCDTFDSASYILYARQGRYITEDGTRRIKEMGYLSCSCEVCSKYTAPELAGAKDKERIDGIALHNLHAIKSEVDRVKEAIHEGRLWEYTMKKMRAHPRLFESARILEQNGARFIRTTPRFKSRAVFLFGPEDQYRPEVISYHNMAREYTTRKKILCITRDAQIKPAYLSPQYSTLKARFIDPGKVQFCQYNPVLGIIPVEISDIFPAAHYVYGGRAEPGDFAEFAITWDAFLARNKFAEIHYEKTDPFISHFIKRAKGARRLALKSRKRKNT
ncbi:queuine/archaeosine tRNA-ribosyltransferase [Cenarchaeum symbiosum A]|uniref:tRNA-guanine(15) transglycosylase n=1 Tax=Cenarchaeum symbiosum (strain A) TaxID=414004 RepID=A0RY47_CENSY|nr:queuine/archaeosine tRNA-ribosyltransferase [Cenarchaeum symbiosum A]